jgi:hypothetical protein
MRAVSNTHPDPNPDRAWAAWPENEREALKCFRTFEAAESYARAQRAEDLETWFIGKTVAQFSDLEIAQGFALDRLQ